MPFANMGQTNSHLIPSNQFHRIFNYFSVLLGYKLDFTTTTII